MGFVFCRRLCLKDPCTFLTSIPGHKRNGVKVRGHFVTLIELLIHAITCNPGQPTGDCRYLLFLKN